MKYIETKIPINIRFSEVDSLGIVWHGNYFKYFEDGRENLGLTYGMSYADLYKHKLILPIVDTNIQFKSIIKFGHKIELTTCLIKKQAAKVIHQYIVRNLTTDSIAAIGETTQVFVDEKMELQLITPPAFEKWKSGLQWIEK